MRRAAIEDVPRRVVALAHEQRVERAAHVAMNAARSAEVRLARRDVHDGA
jgi:hypothetical protein